MKDQLFDLSAYCKISGVETDETINHQERMVSTTT